jgi:hypothetical protein
MSAEIEIPDRPPWPAALAGGADAAGRAQSGAVVLAIEHRALVADVHAWFLVHGLAASDPTQPAGPPPRSWPVVLPPDRAQRLGCEPDPGQLLGALQRAGTEWS